MNPDLPAVAATRSMKIEEAMEATVPPATEPGRPEIHQPPPPACEPDREEEEYLEWRQELL